MKCQSCRKYLGNITNNITNNYYDPDHNDEANYIHFCSSSCLNDYIMNGTLICNDKDNKL